MNDDKKGQLISYIKAVLINNDLPEDTKYEDLPEDLKPQIMKARSGLTTVSKTNVEIARNRTVRISLNEYNALKEVARSAGVEVGSDGKILNFNDEASKSNGGMQYTKNDGVHTNGSEEQKVAA